MERRCKEECSGLGGDCRLKKQGFRISRKPCGDRWIYVVLSAAWLVVVRTTAVAEAGEVALAVDFPLNLKSAANFAFALNASLLFVVGTAMVVMGVTYDSA